jgi:hypothetical protein
MKDLVLFSTFWQTITYAHIFNYNHAGGHTVHIWQFFEVCDYEGIPGNKNYLISELNTFEENSPRES